MTGFAVAITDDEYSPDVELDAAGRVVFTRTPPPGHVLQIPRVYWPRLLEQSRCVEPPRLLQ